MIEASEFFLSSALYEAHTESPPAVHTALDKYCDVEHTTITSVYNIY